MSRKLAVKQNVTQSFLISCICHTLSWHVVFLSGTESVQVFILIIFFISTMYYHWRFNYQEGIPLTNLTQPHCCACPKPEPEFPMLCVMFYFMFNDLR
jgi:hypothetical protein